MSRPGKRAADLGFAAITIEGGLISPEQITAIASATPDQKTAAEYGCPKGTSLRDEITRYFRIGQAHWQSFSTIDEPTVTQTAGFVRVLLEEAFGFSLAGPVTHDREGRRFRIAWEAKAGKVPIVVAAPATGEDGKLADGFTRAQPEFGDGPDGRIARRSPAVLLQDWLNANPDFYWGLVFAGDRVRLMRDNASFTRPAYIEADLGAIFRDEMFADFTALWLLIHNSRFGAEGAPASDCALERWREAGMRAGTAARDRLRGNVEDALLSLGQGFLDANPALRQKLDEGALSMSGYFEQLLRTVYRLIFLAVAEDRNLLHAPGASRAVRALYGENYGFAYLRDRSAQRGAHDHHQDAWEGVKIVFNALERGEGLLGLPALGSLFSRGLTPDLGQASLPNRALLAAIYKLGWLIDDKRRVRINWRDMATEELGSVYEGLLELVPMREDEGRTFTLDSGLKGNTRKTSGSYYTPDSLVQTLLDSALDPVLDRAEAEGGVEAILALRVIDPASGSGHFLLGAARRMATRVAQLRDSDAPDYHRALRDVVSSCIYGVDRNPMAVELAKVALWIESVSPGQPLGFLDANIRCGDALLGVFDLEALEQGIPDDAYKPLTGDSEDAAKYWNIKNKNEKKGQGAFDFDSGGGAMPPRKLAANLSTIRRMSEDTVSQVEKKREAFEAWRRDPDRYATKVACDLYTAAYLLPKLEVPENYQRGQVPTTADVWKKLGGGQIYGPLEAASVDAAEFARAFHWPLAFPDVLIGKGGFDVVLGNPPWEKFTILEREFFAAYSEIAEEANASKRKRLISAAFEKSPELAKIWGKEQRLVSAFGKFLRSSNRFKLSAVGELNLYPLFAELSLSLLSATGKSGLIVKSMMFTGSTWKGFTDYLITSGRLESVFDFKNWEMLFPTVGYHERYSLATFTGAVTETVLKLAVGLTHSRNLVQEGVIIKINREIPRQLNPDTGTLPQCESSEDLRILTRVATAFPTLGVSPWHAHYTSGLHMTSDAAELRDLEELQGAGYKLVGSWFALGEEVFAPVYEGKLIHQFDHRFATFDGIPPEKRFGIKAATITPTLEVKGQRDFEILPRYWVRGAFQEANLAARGLRDNWNIAFRDTTNVISNFRTAVGCVVGPAAFNYKAPNIVISKGDPRQSALFLSMFNSTPFDYLIRQKFYGANFTKSLLLQSFVVPPEAVAQHHDSLIDAVVALTNTSDSVIFFAKDLDRTHLSTTNPEERLMLRAWIDAVYFTAFGFARSEVEYVFGTFPIWKEKSENVWGRFRERDEALRFFENME
ncbi:N-6 DNA methylase [Alteraurantiacibacter aestuarii]|uniref:site-specific DNA-methyltransferase (adenine-specific) n=1 Tax=Alteraurantiacibacter aestuarii TaxID=650004 RepID=A0A844ZI43_9SPHN|nr:N-6 DNA methylase [Alteraurantiacibacter aestuarii]MXO87234.1 N-6 DNA methylase [Alteraurantiacibacter aestuarii]